jgi:hypothetical protein
MTELMFGLKFVDRFFIHILICISSSIEVLLPLNDFFMPKGHENWKNLGLSLYL